MLQNKIYVGMDISKDTVNFYNPGSTGKRDSWVNRCKGTKRDIRF